MRRWTLFFASLGVVSALGCSQPPGPPKAEEERPAADTTRDQLAFRLSDADPPVEAIERREVAIGVPLGEAEAAKLLGRLPALVEEPADDLGLSLPTSSLPVPHPGIVVEGKFPPDQKSPPVPQSTPIEVAPSGPLLIERFGPEGEGLFAPNVSLTFSQPMVPVSSLRALSAHEVPATISPQPEGTWSWIGTKTLIFQPTEEFPMATAFTVSVPAGTRSVSGQVLERGLRWSFSTPPPTLESWHPTAGSTPTGPLLFAAFDQAIDPEVMIRSIELRTADKKFQVRLATREEIEQDQNVQKAVSRAKEGRWLAFRPTRPLPRKALIEVRIAKGAKGAEGPLPTKEDQRSWLKTLDSFSYWTSICQGREGCTPGASFLLRFTNPVDASRFAPALVQVSPEIAGMTAHVRGDGITLSGATEASTSYKITFSPELTDIHGQKLGRPATTEFHVTPPEPWLSSVRSRMLVLDPFGSAEYTTYSINYRSIRTRVYSVTPEDWDDFVYWQNDLLQGLDASPPPGELALDEFVQLDNRTDETVATTTDLRPALNQGLGHLIVHVTAERTTDDGRIESKSRGAWIQATKIGLYAIFEHDRIIAWATKLEDGTPLDDVEISLLGSETSALTKDGLATVPMSPGHPLVARRGADIAFLSDSGNSRSFVFTRSQEQLETFAFTDRGTYRPGEEVHVKGWVRVADRVRSRDLHIPSRASLGEGISYRVIDRRSVELARGRLALDAHGGFNLSIALSDHVNLGSATMLFEAVEAPAQQPLGSLSFFIQEFRRPEYEVQTRVNGRHHIAGGEAIATTSATYYTGGGLPGAAVQWTIQQHPDTFRPPRQGGFHFGPPQSWSSTQRRRASPLQDTWSSHTDERGSDRLRLNVESLDPPYPYWLRLTANVTDLNRQRWSDQTSMWVHPSDQYVGLRLPRNYVGKGEPLEIDLVVSDRNGVQQGGRPIEVRAARIHGAWRGHDFIEDEVDIQRCQIESLEKEPARCTLPTSVGGRYRVTAVVTDEAGRRNQSAIETFVMGGAGVPSLGGSREVELIADRSDYQPGDVAKVLVISPFAPAEGLLTVNLNGVIKVERFTMEASSQELQIQLDDAMVPSVTLQVALVGTTSREAKKLERQESSRALPSSAKGFLPLKVLPSKRVLSVRARPRNSELPPGGHTIVDVEVRNAIGKPVRNAQVAVIIADEAVLRLSKHKTPDPLRSFYAYYGAEPARSLDSRGHLNLELSGESLRQRERVFGVRERYIGDLGPGAIGGLGSRGTSSIQPGEKGAETAPIELRSDYSPLALFAPRLLTNTNGKASVAVTLPDDLTRYRVMAIASAGDHFFGSSEATITARLPLMVRPSAPRLLNFGDSFELSVLLQNQTEEPMDVDVVANASNASIDRTPRRVSIPPGDRVEVRFPAAAKRPGKARFQFGVASPGFSDASEVEVPVYAPAKTERFATYGELEDGVAAQAVQLPEDVFADFGGLEISTASTQLSALTDAVLYLAEYPFDCHEQLASRLLGIASLRDVLTAFRADGLPPPEKLEAKILRDLEALETGQHESGGWSFWRGQPEAWPFVSVHVAHALVRAKEMGYEPSPLVFRRAMRFLREIEVHIPAGYRDDVRHSLTAYAHYVRWRHGEGTAEEALQLVAEAGGVEGLHLDAIGWIWPTLSGPYTNQREGLTPVTASHTFRSDAQIEVLEKLRRLVSDRLMETAGAAHFVTGYGDQDWLLLHTNRRTDGLLLEALITDQPESTLIPKLVRGLLGHRRAGRWRNTQENSFVLLALQRYFNQYEGVRPDFVARMWLGEHFGGEHSFRGYTTEQHELRLPMSWLVSNAPGTQDLTLSKEGPGRLYYRIGMRYAPLDFEQPPVDRGFVVSRTYEGADNPEDVQQDEDGTWRVRLGATVRVRVSMGASGRRHHVALVDPLPAGFEPLNPTLAVTGVLPKDESTLGEDGRSVGWWRRLFSRTWYEHQNLRDDRAEAFASLLYSGVWSYSYLAIATTAGTFVAPPTKAEEMYSPETFGRGAQDRVIVQ